MIPVKIARNAHVADDFTRLGEYIAAAREEGEKLDRLWIANCDAGTEPADLDAALAEIEAVRQMRPDVDDKSYHLVVSFRPGDREKLDDAALKDIAQTFAEALGYGDHQYVAGTHINTDNFHLHVAFSKVHPETLKVPSPFKDYQKLEKAARALEKKYGLVVDRGMSDAKREDGLSPAARDFEATTWLESFQRYVTEHRPALLEGLKACGSWSDVHALMARYDIRITPHGAGLVLTDASGEQAMKASALHRSCSKGALEKRFGPFQPAPPGLEPEPAAEEEREKGSKEESKNASEEDGAEATPAGADAGATAEAAEASQELQDADTDGAAETVQPEDDAGDGVKEEREKGGKEEAPGEDPSAGAGEADEAAEAGQEERKNAAKEDAERQSAADPSSVGSPDAAGGLDGGDAAKSGAPEEARKKGSEADRKQGGKEETEKGGKEEPPPPLRPPPAPVARYRPRPLVRHLGMEALWRSYRQERGRRRPSLLGKAARNWKMFLLSEAYNDPYAFVIIMAHQEFLASLFGDDEPAPPRPVQPELAAAVAAWRNTVGWADGEAAPWLKEQQLVSSGTRSDDAGNLIIPFRDVDGRVQGVRMLAKTGQHLDVGLVRGPSMHLIEPKRTLTKGATVIVTTDYGAAVAIRRATKAPVVVAPSEADVPAVLAALAKKHGGIRPVLAATSPEVTAVVKCPRVLLPDKRPPHVLRSLFAPELGDKATLAWDATIDWARPTNNEWLAINAIPGSGVRLTAAGEIAVPLRTLSRRLEDVMIIGRDGSRRRVVDMPPDGPLVHIMDRQSQLGTAPIILSSAYEEAAAVHRATGRPVVMAADITQWPQIAEALRQKYPQAPIILPTATPPDEATKAAAEALGVTLLEADCHTLIHATKAEDLREVFAPTLQDEAFLRWQAARPATRADAEAFPWLTAGRASAAARIDDVGDALLPLRDGDLRLVGVLAVGPDGRERYRIEPPPPCAPPPADDSDTPPEPAERAPEALYHVLGGWLGEDGDTPLVITPDLPAAIALHRETPATVVHAAGDLAATIEALHRRMPGRPITVASVGTGGNAATPTTEISTKHLELQPEHLAVTPNTEASDRLHQVLQTAGLPTRAYRAAALSWDKTTDWAAPKNSPWLKDQGVPGFGVRLTVDGDLAVPLRTLSGRMDDIMVIGADGSRSRLVDAGGSPLVHRIDPHKRFGKDPVVIARSYEEAAAIHRATRAPVLMAADPAEWPEIAKAVREKHSDVRVVVPLPPAEAAAAEDLAAEVGATVVPRDCSLFLKPKETEKLRAEMAEAVDDQVILRLRDARPVEAADRETLPWLPAGRGAAQLRIDEAGHVLLPLRDGTHRLAGILAVDADGHERWRLDDLRQDSPQALYHVVGGWAGRRTDALPLVVTSELATAVTLQRELKGPVVQAVGDVPATVEVLRTQYPGRRILLVKAGPTPEGLEIERVELPKGGQWPDCDERRAVREALAAVKVATRERYMDRKRAITS